MQSKGITPIVAVILIILISVSLGSLFAFWSSKTFEETGQIGKRQTEHMTGILQKGVKIESVSWDGLKIYIKNKGTITIYADELAVYVNDTLYDFTANDIEPDEVGTLTLTTPIPNGNYIIRVAAAGASDSAPAEITQVETWIFFEDFENNWGCYKTGVPGSSDECTANSPWGDFNNCDDNSDDYLFCTSDDGQEGSHTTRAIQMIDWYTWRSGRGVFYAFDPRAYSDIRVEGYMAAASLESGEFCRIWVVDDDSWATIYQCVDNVPAGCEAGDSTPEPSDYRNFSVELSTLSGIDLTDTEIEIHIGADQSGAYDFCFWDGIRIIGVA